MIIEYKNGKEFINDNLDILNNSRYQANLFFANGNTLMQTDENNFALKCIQDDKFLLILRLVPRNTLIYGDEICVREMMRYISDRGYNINNYLSESTLGNTIKEVLTNDYNFQYYKALEMDFMESRKIAESSSDDVEKAKYTDIDEIFECMKKFIIDVGIIDEVKREKIENNISLYRIIRKDNKIVSFAKFKETSDDTMNISDVYTRPEYRGRKLAKKVVNAIKNEIIEKGKIATLNVDQKNPISNHVYQSLGFKKVFSQTEYRKVNK